MGWKQRIARRVLLGLAASFAVAIGCGTWSPDAPTATRLENAESRFARRYPELTSSCFVGAGCRERTRYGRSVRVLHGLIQFADDPDRDTLTVHVIRLGWPAPALHGEYHFGTYLPHNSLRGAFRLPNWAGNPQRLIAFRPLLAGLVIDVLVYAGIAWLLLDAPRALRGVVRRRRNRCPSCGYPAGPSPACPECGHPDSTPFGWFGPAISTRRP